MSWEVFLKMLDKFLLYAILVGITQQKKVRDLPTIVLRGTSSRIG